MDDQPQDTAYGLGAIQAQPIFTQAQYHQILKLLQKDESPTEMANMAGKSTNSQVVWIVDSCATNHMIAVFDLLNCPTVVPDSNPKSVHLPTGENTFKFINSMKCPLYSYFSIQYLVSFPIYKGTKVFSHIFS